ncbi:hypothetical protein CR513_29402, partial [Mucuna pruriens]
MAKVFFQSQTFHLEEQLTEGRLPYTSQGSINIKCFKCLERAHMSSQCPNKRKMMLRENGNVSNDLCVNSPPSSEGEEECVAYAPDGDLLMVRRLLVGSHDKGPKPKTKYLPY